MAAPAVTGVIHRKRFNVLDDLHLLREVLNQNPYSDSTKWTGVTQAVNAAREKDFTARGCRERMDLLLNLFRKQDWNNLKKSGSDEQYKEKVALLQEVSDLEAEYGGPRARVSNSVRRSLPPPKPKDVPLPVQATTAVVADTSEPDLLCQVYEEGEDASPQPSFAYSEHEEAPITGDVEVVLPDTVTAHYARWQSKRDEGKRRYEDLDTDECSEKRLAIDEVIREKELQLEERRLKLEEERLSLEKAKFEADREFELRKLQMEEDDRKARRESERLQADLMRKMFDELVKKIK